MISISGKTLPRYICAAIRKEDLKIFTNPENRNLIKDTAANRSVRCVYQNSFSWWKMLIRIIQKKELLLLVIFFNLTFIYDGSIAQNKALYQNSLLSESYQNQLFTPQVDKFAPYYYGYGWYIADLQIGLKTKRIFYHTGGGSCIIFRSPQDKQTVIILNNIPSNKLYEIGLKILNVLQGKQ